MLKRLIKVLFKRAGYKITAITTDQSHFFSMFTALKRCLDRGVQPQTVLDIGASDGRWTMSCMKLIPNARYLLIEAQTEHRVALEQLSQKHHNIDYQIAAAGSQSGQIYFDAKELFGGLASFSPIEGGIQVPMVSIDDEVVTRKLSKPYLLKLDTHGFEIPILEGAKRVLRDASLVIIEAYNYQLTPDSLRFFELCEYMDNLGFAPIEIADPMLRLHDSSFWQMDIFFIPKTSPEFAYRAYK
jgi:FkbM family methyltransferase